MRQLSFVLPAFSLLLTGCGPFGTVNQGRVIDYQRETRLVTLVPDSNYKDADHPRFDVLPPVSVETPADPREMGPAPAAGKLLGVDSGAGRLAIFNSATRRIEEIPYKEVGPAADCAAAPVVDRERKTIVLCAGHKGVVVSVADQYLALPDDTWKVGDEVRYYYKDPARALRFMNVTKTNLNKGD